MGGPTEHQNAHEVSFLDVHGHRRAYVRHGQGPGLLLIHGIGCDHSTWHPVIDALAERFTVIAPDLLGHGASAKPRADYSLGGYANAMRDLLKVLDVHPVTVVGHSFGGGVAMQFAYQYPELTDRLILVSSGGLGPEVTPILRAITTPGFHEAMGVLTLPGVRQVNSTALRLLSRLPLAATRDLDEVAGVYESLSDPRARAATRHLVRGVIDWRGQIVTMADRAYLTAVMPLMVLWGEDDMVLPVRHLETISQLAPEAEIVRFAASGHFPHRDYPEAFVSALEKFVDSTPPAVYDEDLLRELLIRGPARRPITAEAGEAPVSPVVRQNVG